MRWLGGRESENVEDRRGMGGGGFPVGITGGVGAIVVLIVGLFLGIDPSTLMAVLNGYAPDTQSDSRQADQPGYGSRRGAQHGRLSGLDPLGNHPSECGK